MLMIIMVLNHLKYFRDFLVNDKDPNSYCIVGYKLGNTLSDHGHVNRGVCKVEENGFLRNIVETRQIEKTTDGALPRIGWETD